ncbi:36045_t:CDS:2 [Racocetra persica]|uniref:36045_t:CDS:1 n=1 Tax=Racocetra persica TaxID=160502 RepID=A0ACA9MGB7_9GLOM|nr:36045_t:CDS:2 [Racocetra persica]
MMKSLLWLFAFFCIAYRLVINASPIANPPSSSTSSQLGCKDFPINCVVDSQCGDGQACRLSKKGSSCVSNTTSVDDQLIKNVQDLGCAEAIKFVPYSLQVPFVFVTIQADLTAFSS